MKKYTYRKKEKLPTWLIVTNSVLFASFVIFSVLVMYFGW